MVLTLPNVFLAVGDIHGNVAALNRAFEVAKKLDIEPVFFGDIVGGSDDSECIQMLRESMFLTIRGNHDHWAIEKATNTEMNTDISWLSSLKFEAENGRTLAVHTNYIQNSDGFVEWHQLQASLEIQGFLQKHPKKANVLAAHTHFGSVSLWDGESLTYISNSKLRANPKMKLSGKQNFIDIGWAHSNVVVFDDREKPSQVEFIWLD